MAFCGCGTASKRTVTKAVDLYHAGLSCRQVANHFDRHEREHPSKTSSGGGFYKFARLVKRFLARLIPKLSERWQAGEMCLFMKGKPCWNWEVIDEGTRFWLASLLTEG